MVEPQGLSVGIGLEPNLSLLENLKTKLPKEK